MRSAEAGAGRRLLPALLCGTLLLAGCGDLGDDLAPSGDDRRPTVEVGSTGPYVGQFAPDFTVPDSLANPVTLSTELPAVRAVVLYFTMWCPICDSHLSHLRDQIAPRFPNVAFFAVDYVSGSVADARSAQLAHGFGGPELRVLVDLDDHIESAYDATMATTVVIDAGGIVQLNEDYRTGSNLEAVLSSLPTP